MTATKKIITLDNLNQYHALSKAEFNTILAPYCYTTGLTAGALLIGNDKQISSSNLTYNTSNNQLAGLTILKGTSILILQAGSENNIYKGTVKPENLFTTPGDFTFYCYQDPNDSANEFCFIYPSKTLTDIVNLTWTCTGTYNKTAVYKLSAGTLYCVDGTSINITNWTKKE